MRLTFAVAGEGALAFCASNDTRSRIAELVALTSGERVKRALSAKVAVAEDSGSTTTGILNRPNSSAKAEHGNRIKIRAELKNDLEWCRTDLESGAVSCSRLLYLSAT